MFEDGVWRTIAGRRVFIKEGQSLSDAMKNSGKFKTQKNDIQSKLKKQFEKNSYEEYIEKLKDKNVEVDKEFIDKFDKELGKEQLKAINDIIDNDKVIQNYLKEHPLKVTAEPRLFDDACYGHVPQDPNMHQITYNSRLNFKDTVEKTKELRNNGKWMSEKYSNVSNEQYITYHEMGHLKEQIAVQRYLRENPKFKEKYMNKLNKAKSQTEYDTITKNMHNDTLYHIKEEKLIPIQEKNGTITKAGGRQGTTAYGDYGTNEMSKYGSKNEMNEFFSESNIIYSKPTQLGKNTQLYKDFSDLMKEVY